MGGMKQQFDLFGARDAAESVAPAPSPARSGVRGAQDETRMVRQLEDTGRYRVLRKLQPRPVVEAPRPAFPLRGVILDTETTGLNADRKSVV